MEQSRRNLRSILAVMACVLFMPIASRLGNVAVRVLSHPRVAEFLIYVETGRPVRLDVPQTEPTEAPPTTAVTQPPKQPILFAAQDAQRVQLSNFTGYTPDLEGLLTSPLSWNLTSDGPAVLILHTHATESYSGTPGYRTEDAERNMLRVGREIARVLEENGIGVIHDTTLHDKPSYNGSYSAARKTIAARLAENPSIRLVLDVHRDALELTDAVQLSTHAQVNGQDSAQLMLVMGTNAGGLQHPAWHDNLSVAVKLQTLLEGEHPGLFRRMQLRTERFNQDLSPGGMLLEVGAAGDTLEEALVAARTFALGIVALAQGTATAGSTS